MRASLHLNGYDARAKRTERCGWTGDSHPRDFQFERREGRGEGYRIPHSVFFVKFHACVGAVLRHVKGMTCYFFHFMSMLGLCYCMLKNWFVSFVISHFCRGCAMANWRNDLLLWSFHTYIVLFYDRSKYWFISLVISRLCRGWFMVSWSNDSFISPF